jgi:hypothetical protein
VLDMTHIGDGSVRVFRAQQAGAEWGGDGVRRSGHGRGGVVGG